MKFKKIFSLNKSVAILLILLIYGIFIGNEGYGLGEGFIPDAPVINFKLPMFGVEGYRSWFVRGDEGIYVNEDRVDVVGMMVSIFSGDEKELVEAEIESPRAAIFIHENRASGEDLIEVKGEGYALVGKDWTWEGNLKKMCINKEVKVVFDQSLKGMLDYEKQ